MSTLLLMSDPTPKGEPVVQDTSDDVRESLRKPKRKLIFLVPTLLLLLVVLVGVYVQNSTISKKNTSYTSNVLTVLHVWVNTERNPSQISVRFNHPVDTHTISHYVAFTPNVSGSWESDTQDSTVLTYKFSDEFSGKNLAITVTKGLISTNKKALLYDFEKYFAINKNISSQSNSRVRSYPAGYAIPLENNADSISIYTSNAHNLLQYLQYEIPESSADQRSPFNGNFSEIEVAHSDLYKLQNIVVNSQNKTVTLTPGVYYVVGDSAYPYFLVISTYGTVLRQDDKEVHLGVFNILDGTKVNESVSFGFYNLHNGIHLLRDFVYTGEDFSQPLVYPQRLDAVIGIYRDEVMFVPVEVLFTLADIQVTSDLDKDEKLFIYTDRPIYKPGDTVFVRGILRLDSDSAYRVPTTSHKAYLRLPNYEEREKDQLLTVDIDDQGVFYANFVIPDTSNNRYATVEVSTQPLSNENYRRSTAYIEILKYIKPEFEILTNVEKAEYLRHEDVVFTLKGNYFDKKPLVDKEIEYQLYMDNFYEVEKAVYNKNFNITSIGGMCGGGGFEEYYGSQFLTGKAKLNADGEARIKIQSPDAVLSQKITLVAKTKDRSGNELVSAVNTIVHASTMNIFFMPSADRYSAGDEFVAPFYVESLQGEKVRNSSFGYTLVNYQYSENATQNKTPIITGNVTTDEQGKGSIVFRIPSDITSGTKILTVSTKDANNNRALTEKTINILTDEEKNVVFEPRWGDRISQTYLKISSSQNSFKVGDTIKLMVDAPENIDAFLTLERGRIYEPRFIYLPKGQSTVDIPVSPELSPSITAVFSFFANGTYHSEGLSLNIPAMHKLLSIDVSATKITYAPNETAELVIKTRDYNGMPIAADLSVGIVDKAIYALRKSATPPVHSSFYYFRPRRTNASSSLTGLGDYGGMGGGGGGGANSLGSTVDILYWNPNLRTDNSGEVRIPVPLLGHETIWKATVIGSTNETLVGQSDLEFTVRSDVQGVNTESKYRRNIFGF